MPQIGWSEILVIVILTIIIVGPKDEYNSLLINKEEEELNY